MRRLLSLLVFLPALATVADCGKQTELVVELTADEGSVPPAINIKLHRSTPFADNPTTPAFVVSSLNGSDLDFQVTPQGSSTVISLLPPKSGAMDVRISV